MIVYRAVFCAIWMAGVLYTCSIVAEPLVRSDFKFEMPYDETLWLSQSHDEWDARRASAASPILFKAAFKNLFTNSGSSIWSRSVLGHLALMVALYNHTCQCRAVAMPLPPLLAEQVLQSISVALCRWLMTLEAFCGSTDEVLQLNPSLAGSSVILWEATCVELHGNVSALAQAKATVLGVLKDGTDSIPLFGKVERSQAMEVAIWHSLAFVRGPITAGIHFMQTTGGVSLNVGHCLFGFRCIILLIRWLYTLETAVVGSCEVTENEHRILDTLDLLLEDAGIDGIMSMSRSRATATVWAEILTSSNLIWGIGKVMGNYLASNLSRERQHT